MLAGYLNNQRTYSEFVELTMFYISPDRVSHLISSADPQLPTLPTQSRANIT